MTIPQGYKQTELGIIPEDWEVKNLGALCRLYGRIGFRGYTKADLVRKGEGAITLSPADIVDQCINFSDCDYISWKKYDESPEIKVRCGDIVFCKTASIGKCAIIRYLPEKATINPQFVVIKEFKCHNEWLYYQLIDRKFQQAISGITGGSTIPTMSQEKLCTQCIVCPKDIAEQRAIAEALSDVDGLIAALDKKIAKKRLVKQGAMQQLLTGKIRLPGFTDEWVMETIATVCDILDNKRVPLNEEQRKDGIYPYCGANGIVAYIDKYIFDEDLILIAEDGGNFDQFESRPIAYLMTGKYWVNNHAHVLKAKNNYCQDFIFYQLEHKDITDYIVGGTRTKLTRAQLDRICIKLPQEVDEQQAIATILSDMDKEIADLEAQRDKYRLLKSGMMQKLLTGQIRLKTK